MTAPTDDPLDPLAILDRAHAASTGGRVGARWIATKDRDDETACVYTSIPPTRSITTIAETREQDSTFIVAAHNHWPAVSEELMALREVEELARRMSSWIPMRLALAKLDAARGRGTK